MSDIISFDGKATVDVQGYPDVKFSEMMKDYPNKWMAYLGLGMSFITALNLPMFGFVLS